VIKGRKYFCGKHTHVQRYKLTGPIRIKSRTRRRNRAPRLCIHTTPRHITAQAERWAIFRREGEKKRGAIQKFDFAPRAFIFAIIRSWASRSCSLIKSNFFTKQRQFLKRRQRQSIAMRCGAAPLPASRSRQDDPTYHQVHQVSPLTTHTHTHTTHTYIHTQCRYVKRV
jgi:hypothetical protein